MADKNPFVDFPGQIGVRVDRQSGRVAVQLTGGFLSTPVQMSAKLGSESEQVLLDALLLAKVWEMKSGSYAPGTAFASPYVHLYAWQQRDSWVEFVISSDRLQTRLVVDCAARQIRFLAPRDEVALALLIHQVPQLSDFEVITPSAEQVFVLTDDLAKGDRIVVQGTEAFVRQVRRPQRDSGESLPHQVDIVTEHLTFNIRGRYEPVQVLPTVESVTRQLRLLPQKSADSVQFELLGQGKDQTVHIISDDGVKHQRWTVWVLLHEERLVVTADLPAGMLDRLLEKASLLRTFQVSTRVKRADKSVQAHRQKMPAELLQAGHFLLRGGGIHEVEGVDMERRDVSVKLRLLDGPTASNVVLAKTEVVEVTSEPMAQLLAQMGVDIQPDQVELAERLLAAGWSKP